LAPISQTGYFTDYVSQDLDHGFVMITHPQLLAAAQNYSAWRNSGEVHSRWSANVEELYMQYAYGIEKTPTCDSAILQ
jgi:hypothetical protein